MNLRFVCPDCEHPGRIDLPASSADWQSTPREWQCPGCDHLLRLCSTAIDHPLETCLLCGNAELYKKKDFPHWLGMTILGVACLAFLVLNGGYKQWWAWGILLGSALIDGALYLWVRDVIVCYRCSAHYRGFAPNPAHHPYELAIGERYRQEKIRREHLKQRSG